MSSPGVVATLSRLTDAELERRVRWGERQQRLNLCTQEVLLRAHHLLEQLQRSGLDELRLSATVAAAVDRLRDADTALSIESRREARGGK